MLIIALCLFTSKQCISRDRGVIREDREVTQAHRRPQETTRRFPQGAQDSIVVPYGAKPPRVITFGLCVLLVGAWAGDGVGAGGCRWKQTDPLGTCVGLFTQRS